jgi:predicted AlkP superfamily phosphohydrolase/phosphomutase
MTRTLFIGMDAADRDLVATLAASGDMPNVAALTKRGTSVDIEVPDAFYVGAVWPSFYTGCATTRHGRYCYKQYVPGTYRSLAVTPDDVPFEPFWAALDQAGRRVIVIDVPKSRPIPLSHGIHIVDWGTHDPERHGFACVPAHLADEIRQRFGIEPVGNCDRAGRNPGGYARFVKNLSLRIARKEAMTRHLMAEQAWDFVGVCFSESHCVGHQCWHLHDPSHEWHQRKSGAGDPVERIYRELDAAVGRLVAAAGEATNVFLLFSHGMGSHYDGGHLMKEALKRINSRLPFGRSRAEQLEAYQDAKDDPSVAEAGIRILPDGLPMPAQVRSFLVPNNDAFVGIRLNIVGRERFGRLLPGEDTEGYVDTLTATLRKITIGPDGPRAFARIFRTEEAYPDRQTVDALPDIIAEWSRAAPYHALCSPAIGTIEGDYKGVRSGDHRAGGRLVVAGPGIDAAILPAARTEDIAPTICASLGVALAGIDGRPIAFSDVQSAVA